MKKIHQATRKGNKWVRKTRWQLDAEDILCGLFFLIVVGFVVIRSLIG